MTTKADGGRVKVNTEQIAAYPIGGLKGDNTVVVNAQQQPLFTMNTNESAVMNPNTKTVDVLPNKKETAVQPMQQEQSPIQNMVNEFQSAVQDLKNTFYQNQGKKPEMTAQSPRFDNDPSWINQMTNATATPIRNPTAQRFFYRAGGQETGDPTNGFHHSRGNVS